MKGPHEAPTLWDPHPVARSTDPGTSWAAAASVQRIRESHELILRILGNRGMSDVEIWRELEALPHGPRMSPSGARTRRRELVDRGLVRDSGYRQRLQTGRWAILWVRA